MSRGEHLVSQSLGLARGQRRRPGLLGVVFLQVPLLTHSRPVTLTTPRLPGAAPSLWGSAPDTGGALHGFHGGLAGKGQHFG